MRGLPRVAAFAILFAALALLPSGAGLRAQLTTLGGGQPIQRDQPVFYQADAAQYSRDQGLVTLSGNVEIWQGDRILRADTVTYDRNTGVVAARGHVAMVEPDGEVLFSNYAELSGGMKDGVLRNFSARLAENGKLAANGARRTNAQVNELSRAIYSTCNVCAQHPDQAPLWDIRARSATQDLVDKRIEYRDAVVDMYGVPIMYLPYFTQPDPSVKRASGFLVPALGESSALGPYIGVPYFWAIDPQQDLTITPLVAAKQGPQLEGVYRRRFNSGYVDVDGAIAYDEKSLQGYVFGKGQFALDDEWRYGFDINRATSTGYLTDFKIGSGITDVLTSSVYLEGFGQGAYARLDASAYQGLTQQYVTSELPYVLPRYEYSFVGEPDALGGRLGVETQDFNVVRGVGTNTQRASLSLNWERPATGELGELYKLILHVDSAAYMARDLDQQPSFGPKNDADSAQAMPDVAMDMRWPFYRDAGSLGSQLVEPEVQVIASPYGPSYGIGTRPNGTTYVNSLIPNEDSLGVEFTDANLFALNRFPGIDRLEGGPRAAAALRSAWYFPNGAVVDGLVGQSYRTHKDSAFPNGSGLEDSVSDVVSRLTFTPNQYLDLTTRARFDHRNWNIRYGEAIGTAGPSWLRLNAGYIYEAVDPLLYYSSEPTGTFTGPPRNELTLGASTAFAHYRLSAFGVRDLENHAMVLAGVNGAYEDECFVFSANLARRYTSLNGDHGDTTVLFQITLKTVGQFGFHAF